MQLHPSITTADATVSQSGQPGTSLAEPSSRLRRRLVWAAVVAAVLLLLIFTPPLVNANRYQRQIARSMSESLGRPVHLDNVTLHLLPVPGLTLSNLVVSEDPAFGAEPTIRANTVEATLRLSSLWRRHVEFSTVRFVEPSVNLVRNQAGRWNLANVLLHASHVEIAPTAQRRPGPAPRFPYIEATGGRVNIKLDEEKLPFSLTEADFALWLPSANHWRVRLEGQPARTDTNLNDPGVFRLEGDLQRAGAAGDVPVDLHASWHDAPLGEASLMLTADDLGWRGTLNLEASLTGTLNAAQLHSKITLGALRRADFAAVHPLDLQITCASGLSVEDVTLRQLQCTMPDSAPEPVVLQAAALNLQRPAQARVTVDAAAVPLHWGLLWAALFSARVPTELYPRATADLHLEHLPAGVLPGKAPTSVRHRSRAVATAYAAGSTVSAFDSWTGDVTIHLPPAPALQDAGASAAGQALPIELQWHLDPAAAVKSTISAKAVSSNAFAGGIALRLEPVTLSAGPGESVALTGTLSSTGYSVGVNGTASAPTLLLPARYLPQLGDGLESILPFPPTGSQPSRVEFTCTHPWGAVQTCTSFRPTASASRTILRPAVPPVPGSGMPVLLKPHSLSPLDHDPQLGGSPQQQ